MVTPPRITAALAAAALMAFLAAAPASASTARVTSSAQPAAVLPTECEGTVQCVLVDPYSDIEARYNSTAGYWRSAATVDTPVAILAYGSDDYVVEDIGTGDFMDYDSGYIEETSNDSLARAHWDIVSCGSDTYTFANVYEDDQDKVADLAGGAAGDPLYMAAIGCDAEDSWELEGSLVAGSNQ